MIRRKNSLLQIDITLNKFYFRKSFFSIRTILCLILLFFPLFNLILSYNTYINPLVEYHQNFINNAYFWGDFMENNLNNIFLPILPLISLLITADSVSGEFSNRTAIVLYTNLSRKTIIRAKIEFLVMSLVIYVSLLWISLIIATSILFHAVISFSFLITGYILVFAHLLFYVAFSFLLSSLTQNTFIAFLVPFFYISFSGIFITLDMELLSYNYYGDTLFSFFGDILSPNNYIINDFPLLLFSFIIYFGLPIILFIVTYYEFKRIDIRV